MTSREAQAGQIYRHERLAETTVCLFMAKIALGGVYLSLSSFLFFRTLPDKWRIPRGKNVIFEPFRQRQNGGGRTLSSSPQVVCTRLNRRHMFPAWEQRSALPVRRHGHRISPRQTTPYVRTNMTVRGECHQRQGMHANATEIGPERAMHARTP